MCGSQVFSVQNRESEDHELDLQSVDILVQEKIGPDRTRSVAVRGCGAVTKIFYSHYPHSPSRRVICTYAAISKLYSSIK